MWFTGNYVELQLTRAQAESCSHPGPCDSDVLFLSNDPKVRRQLDRLDPESLRKELEEYGAWDADELADHEQNLQRILWLAAGDICDRSCKE